MKKEKTYIKNYTKKFMKQVYIFTCMPTKTKAKVMKTQKKSLIQRK